MLSSRLTGWVCLVGLVIGPTAVAVDTGWVEDEVNRIESLKTPEGRKSAADRLLKKLKFPSTQPEADQRWAEAREMMDGLLASSHPEVREAALRRFLAEPGPRWKHIGLDPTTPLTRMIGGRGGNEERELALQALESYEPGRWMTRRMVLKELLQEAAAEERRVREADTRLRGLVPDSPEHGRLTRERAALTARLGEVLHALGSPAEEADKFGERALKVLRTSSRPQARAIYSAVATGRPSWEIHPSSTVEQLPEAAVPAIFELARTGDARVREQATKVIEGIYRALPSDDAVASAESRQRRSRFAEQLAAHFDSIGVRAPGVMKLIVSGWAEATRPQQLAFYNSLIDFKERRPKSFDNPLLDLFAAHPNPDVRLAAGVLRSFREKGSAARDDAALLIRSPEVIEALMELHARSIPGVYAREGEIEAVGRALNLVASEAADPKSGLTETQRRRAIERLTEAFRRYTRRERGSLSWLVGDQLLPGLPFHSPDVMARVLAAYDFRTGAFRATPELWAAMDGGPGTTGNILRAVLGDWRSPKGVIPLHGSSSPTRQPMSEQALSNLSYHLYDDHSAPSSDLVVERLSFLNRVLGYEGPALSAGTKSAIAMRALLRSEKGAELELALGHVARHAAKLGKPSGDLVRVLVQQVVEGQHNGLTARQALDTLGVPSTELHDHFAAVLQRRIAKPKLDLHGGNTLAWLVTRLGARDAEATRAWADALPRPARELGWSRSAEMEKLMSPVDLDKISCPTLWQRVSGLFRY